MLTNRQFYRKRGLRLKLTETRGMHTITNNWKTNTPLRLLKPYVLQWKNAPKTIRHVVLNKNTLHIEFVVGVVFVVDRLCLASS